MRHRTYLAVVVAVVLLGVIVAVLVTRRDSPTAGTGDAGFSTGTLTTACTRALADDMVLLVPHNSPITDRPVVKTSVFDAALCATAEAPQHPPQSSHTLTVAVFAYKPGAGALTPARRCRLGIRSVVADVVHRGGHVVKDPYDDTTTAVLSPLESGREMTVIGCRHGVAVRAAYQVYNFVGAPPTVRAIVAATDHLVQKAFDDLGV